MARKFLAKKQSMSEDYSPTETLEITIDDKSESDLTDDDDFVRESRRSRSSLTDDRRRKKTIRDPPKSHRLIEKRRRDRMNRSLGALLGLIPHKKPENHRRIEKTEIIEMAVKYIRNLSSTTSNSSEPLNFEKKCNAKLDIYSCGYHNGASDLFDYIGKQTDHSSLLNGLLHHINEQEAHLQSLSVLPEKKEKICAWKKPPQSSCDTSDNHARQTSRADHEDIRQFSIDNPSSSIRVTKIPSFVLHPSATHYIPTMIDSTTVAHAFQRTSPTSRSSSIDEPPQCHPITIPVNFNPNSSLEDSYELQIQNINVIGSRHQTSVRPN